MTTTGHSCSRCGARLRRSSRSGAGWCDPCRRAGPDPRRDLPPGFYLRDTIVAALADYDFGVVFRQVRAATGWPQQTLGELVGLEQHRVSAIERGARRLRDVALVAQVATGLCVPAALLGFGGSATTVGTAEGAARKWVSWVDRRDFVQQVAALALGVAGMAALDVDRLNALLPHADPTGTRYVGAADVAVIEQATAAFSGQDFATGSGPVRDLAVGHLRSVLPLLGAQMTPGEVRPRLHLAVARLATQAGWMSFQVNQHDAARRLWMIALDVARDSDHPLATDQTEFVLYDMALQAVALGRSKEALQLAQLGHTAAIGAHPVSAATMSCLAYAQGRAHATQNEPAACERALGQAVEHFTNIDPTHESWADYLDEPMLARFEGVAHYELALASRDPHTAGRAVSLLRQAVDSFGPDFAEPRAVSLTDLAGAHAIAGDIDTAVDIGHQAVHAVTALSSPRAHDRLRVLDTSLKPLHTSTGVAELRERLTTKTV
ncbi:MAG TPA: helix-turn-helix domain-containing protein [Pseudonocardia sp.]|uniref:helix-turn-helix domain-containing protein n=1 Tax=Pseudonocardia sp. TaxID=60912 RepID=UPI002F416EAD